MCLVASFISLLLGMPLEFPQIFFCPREYQQGRYFSRCPEIDQRAFGEWWEGIDRDFKGMGVVLSGTPSGGATLAFAPLGPHWSKYQTWSGQAETVFLSRGRFIGEVRGHDQERLLKRLLIAGYAEACPNDEFSGRMRLAVLAFDDSPEVLFESFAVPRGTITKLFQDWVDKTIDEIE